MRTDRPPRRSSGGLISSAVIGVIVVLVGVGIGLGSWMVVGRRLIGAPGASAGSPSASVAVPSGSSPDRSPAVVIPSSSPGSSSPSASPGVPLASLVGQKLVVRMAGLSPGQSFLRRVRRGEIGGVVLFGFNVRDEAQLRAAADALQAAAREGGQPSLLVMVDQEGGSVRRIPWAPPAESAAAMGDTLDTAAVRDLGRETGRSLAAVGINVDLAPVADVATHDSFMAAAGRTYSADPRLVGQLAAAFAQGLADEGVVATVKHFPGIGRLTRNTDRVAGTVDASAETLDEDLAPFRAAIGAGAPLVMLSNATYPAWDDANAAGWSEPVLRLLRDDLGFRGVTITDSLNGTAESRGTSAKRLASLAARAGTDLLMLTGDEASTAEAFDELLARAASGWLDEDRLRQSYDRILALKATIRP